jgi:poly-gamma-glutamate synthesis protein (capsule biosynthesis protein)
MKKKQIIILSISVLVLAVLSICVYKFSGIFDKEVIADPIEERDSLRIKMVGDDLIHNSIYFAAKTDTGYDFDMMFENVKKDIEEADIAIINQETILVSNPNRYSSYPTFGSPVQVGDAIVKAGFDVVAHATNHTMDKGTSGIEDTLNFWKTNYPDIPILGIHENKEDSDIYYLEKNNIKIAFINYTYGLNGIEIPKGKEYMVDVLGNDEKLIEILKEAKENSDIVIPILHIGTEYVYTPTNYHKKYVNLCIDNGATVVLCAHPHVLEPVEVVVTEEGNKGLVYYSLGNFISNQKQIPTLLGGMADFIIERNDDGKVEAKKYDLIPLVTHYTDNYYTTYKLSDYTNELAKEHKISRTSNFSVEKLWELYHKIVQTQEEV